MDVKYNNLIAVYFTVAVVHSFMVNIQGINLFIFPILTLFHSIFLIKSLRKKSLLSVLHNYLISLILLALLIIYFLLFEVIEVKETFYHLYFLFLIFLCSMIFSQSGPLLLIRSQGGKKDTLYYVVVFYFFGSLFCHLFYWDEIAQIISNHSTMNDLKMDGLIKRSFGLLLNPLTNAFSSLFLFFYLYLSDYRCRLIYWLLAFLIIISAVRSAILILLIFIFFVIFGRKMKFLISLVVMPTLLFFLVKLGVMNVSNGSIDQTGSISAHFNDILIGLMASASFIGNGFVDATLYGGWNLRLEGLFSQYALIYGFPGVFVMMIFHILPAYKSILHKNYNVLIVIVCMFMAGNIFPLHTFLFASFLYVFLMSYIYIILFGKSRKVLEL